MAASALLSPLFYGFDFGTSGVRCCLIDSVRAIVHQDSLSWSSFEGTSSSVSNSWESAMDNLLDRTPKTLRPNVQRICISGTSSTALIYDLKSNRVLRQPRMYNFNVLQEDKAIGAEAMSEIQKRCPKGSAANAPTSTLAKILSWNIEKPFSSTERLFHQADYMIHYLIFDPEKKDHIFMSDWHNALKLGYDVYTLQYPEWLIELLKEQGISSTFLPIVIKPGQSVAAVNDKIRNMGYSTDCTVVAGKLSFNDY
jgi:sugar (pentulose or hexulose) kinase